MLKLTEIFISLEEGFCIYLSFKLLWNGLGLKHVRENVDLVWVSQYSIKTAMIGMIVKKQAILLSQNQHQTSEINHKLA